MSVAISGAGQLDAAMKKYSYEVADSQAHGTLRAIDDTGALSAVYRHLEERPLKISRLFISLLRAMSGASAAPTQLAV